ncbi:MAG TPA: hypothetical protein VLA14_17635 [Polyangia bacterium]|nr:hypothetical protein [Polyangia bacterium]
MAESVLAAGKAAIRRFLRPFLLIQLVAVALVVAYHADARVRAVCAALAAWKTAGGLPLAAATAAFAGGVLPELAKLAAQRGPASADLRGRGGEIAFNMAFFALNGVVVDRLYAVSAALFGADAHLTTIAAKVAFDQFVFTPPWLALVTALYVWRRVGFSTSATLHALRRGGFFRGFVRGRVVPLLLPDWFFWIPMVTVIYAFPVPLQFLLFILALAAWGLILVVIAGGEAAGGDESAAGGESATLGA